MFRSRWWLFCAASTLVPVLGATPPLTTIQDTLFTADGNRFNGVITLSWDSFEAADFSNVAAETRRLSIKNGLLYVQLVPSTDALTPVVYKVQYNSLSSLLFKEAWAVSPSGAALRVRDVRVAPGAIIGSGPGSATIVQISDIVGLQSALNLRPVSGSGFSVSRTAVISSTGAVDGASGSLTDCVHVDGTSGPCGSGGSGGSGGVVFVDGENPSGTLDGNNATFTLGSTPSPASSLFIFRNGLMLRQGSDYTLSNRTVSFLTGAVPQSGDLLLASYRVSGSITGVGFIDAEVPSGVVNSTNANFTLSQTPSPASSLIVYRNGLRLAPNVDYTLSGNSIVFIAGLVPQTGDLLACAYRIAQ